MKDGDGAGKGTWFSCGDCEKVGGILGGTGEGATFGDGWMLFPLGGVGFRGGSWNLF